MEPKMRNKSQRHSDERRRGSRYNEEMNAERERDSEEEALLEQLFPTTEEQTVTTRSVRREESREAKGTRTSVEVTETKRTTRKRRRGTSAKSKRPKKRHRSQTKKRTSERHPRTTEGQKLRASVQSVTAGKRYSVILADPPWRYNNKSNSGAAEGQYATLSENDLRQLPMRQIAEDDCALLLWTTGVKIPEALSLIRAWHFKYITMMLVWIKLKKNGGLSVGCGYYTRSASEYLILASRGNSHRIRKEYGNLRTAVPTVMEEVEEYALKARNEGHSIKPVAIHKIIETLFGDVPRIELFARCRRVGWDAFGNELDKFQDIQYVFHRLNKRKAEEPDALSEEPAEEQEERADAVSEEAERADDVSEEEEEGETDDVLQYIDDEAEEEG